MASSTQDDPNAVVVNQIVQEQAEALSEYWTESALAEAQPIGMEIDDDQATAMFAEMATEWQAEGPQASAQPTAPNGPAAAGWDPQLPCPLTGSTTQRVPNRTVIPYCAVGKLFMTFNGANYVASAWTIGESGVFTAGHCVFDNQHGAGWADKILFVPQYHQGAEPLGRWAATELATLKGWIVGGTDRFKYDLAAFKVDRPVRPVTGSLGWLANASPDQGCITSIGYPAAPPFDGQEMWRSSGRCVGTVNPIQMRNDMTGGCSGGPWEVWFDGAPLSNGLNSFRYTSDPTSMYSPYFGTGFLNLQAWAQ